jgi:hypothetical protein
MNQLEADCILKQLSDGWTTYACDWSDDSHVIFQSPDGGFYEADELAELNPSDRSLAEN